MPASRRRSTRRRTASPPSHSNQDLPRSCAAEVQSSRPRARGACLRHELRLAGRVRRRNTPVSIPRACAEAISLLQSVPPNRVSHLSHRGLSESPASESRASTAGTWPSSQPLSRRRRRHRPVRPAPRGCAEAPGRCSGPLPLGLGAWTRSRARAAACASTMPRDSLSYPTGASAKPETPPLLELEQALRV